MGMKHNGRLLLILNLLFSAPLCALEDTAFISRGRQPDSTAKILAEIREAEQRKIPLEAALKVRNHYAAGRPVDITITVTNLFDTPQLLNCRMLVNHKRLPGEISFTVTGPDGKRRDFQRLVSALELRDQDFQLLARGMCIQRSVDLADFFDMHKKGTYKVQVFYRNNIDQIVGGKHAWMGIVSSEVTDVELQ
jgi:hypothetical protein